MAHKIIEGVWLLPVELSYVKGGLMGQFEAGRPSGSIKNGQ